MEGESVMSKWLEAGDKLEIFEELETHLKAAKELYKELGWENNQGLMEELIDEFETEREEAQEEVNAQIAAERQELIDYYWATR